MERVTHWASKSANVPDWVIMQVVQPHCAGKGGSSWHIPMASPRTYFRSLSDPELAPTDMDWTHIVALEKGLVAVRHSLADYEYSDEPFPDRRRLARDWSNLVGAARQCALSFPSASFLRGELPYREDSLRRADPVDEATVRNATREYVRSWLGKIEDLIARRGKIDLFAHRFVAVDGAPSVVWYYPEGKLRTLTLPIWETLCTSVWVPEGKADRLLYEFNRYTEGGRTKGLFRLVPKGGWAEKLAPYQLDSPYVARDDYGYTSEVLSNSLTGLLCRGVGPEGYTAEMAQMPQVFTGMEDAAIWDAYGRIQQVWLTPQIAEENPDYLSDICLGDNSKKIAVTTICGEESLLLWDLEHDRRRRSRRKKRKFLADLSTCPRCRQSFPRAKGQHSERICDGCADPRLERQRRYWGR